MKNKLKISLIFISLLILSSLILTSCSDTSTKFEELIGDVRVEYSGCTGCLECIDNFNCPVDAIKEDPRTHRTYIDVDDCISCMKCINSFNCPEETIVIHKDVIPPADILNFTAISDSIGKLDIEFTAPGDDAGVGKSHRYEFEFKDMQGNDISVNFSPELPKIGGELERYTIYELPEYGSVVVSIQAFDEMNLSDEKVINNVTILGVHIDSIPPAKINDLTITSSPYSLLLKWSAPGNDEYVGIASEYIIKMYDSIMDEGNFNNATTLQHSVIPNTSGTIDSLLITDVDYDRLHYFAIKTIDGAGNVSEISNSDNGLMTGDIIPPNEISNLNITTISSSSIGVSWTAQGDDDTIGTASSYIMKISTQEITGINWGAIDEYPNSMIPLGSGQTENFFFTGLDALQNYFIAVKTLDDWNNLSTISNIASGTTTDIPDTIPPATTDNLSMTQTADTIVLEWSAPGDDGLVGNAMEYIVKMSESLITETNFDNATTVSNIPSPAISGTSESLEITNLSEGVTYYFALKSYDEANNSSELSNLVSGTILGDIIPPNSISDIIISDKTTTSINIQWTAPGDDNNEGTADSYVIKISTENISDTNWNTILEYTNIITPQPSGSPENLDFTGLLPETTYFIAIKTLDEKGNISNISNVISDSTLPEGDEIAPGKISDISVSSGYVTSSTSMNITWTATGDDNFVGTATSYKIRRSTSAITEANWASATLISNTLTPQSTGSSESFTVTNLSKGVLYYFGIKTEDDNGNISEISNASLGKIVYNVDTACYGCGRCVSACTQGAISMMGDAVIDPSKCNACGSCVSRCPVNAIKLYVISY